MNLKELVNLDEATLKEQKSFHGIIVDEYVTDTAWQLDEIGFLIQYNETGDYLSDDLLDAIIDYNHADVNVILEIPFDFNLNIETVNYCANTTQIDLSLLPPMGEFATEDNWEQYKKQLVMMTESWLGNSNSSFMLYPSSGYFHYMVREYFNGKPSVIADDEYIIKNYVDPIPIDIMDEIKGELRIVFIDHFDGEDGFVEYVNTLADSVADKVEEFSADIIEQVSKNERVKNKLQEVLLDHFGNNEVFDNFINDLSEEVIGKVNQTRDLRPQVTEFIKQTLSENKLETIIKENFDPEKDGDVLDQFLTNVAGIIVEKIKEKV